MIQADDGVTGNFRVLCDGQHDGEREAAEEDVVEAVATTTVGGERPATSSAARSRRVWRNPRGGGFADT